MNGWTHYNQLPKGYQTSIPAIVLIDPKYPHNVGATVRAASCYGIRTVWFTGQRLIASLDGAKRIPREERMRGYAEVSLINYDYPFDVLPRDVTPIAVELRENSEPLPAFEHPEHAVYIFGPEDGSIPKPILTLCHRFVVIPSRHCLNLAAAVYTVLYDRAIKTWMTDNALPELVEPRGFACDLEKENSF